MGASLEGHLWGVHVGQDGSTGECQDRESGATRWMENVRIGAHQCLAS